MAASPARAYEPDIAFHVADSEVQHRRLRELSHEAVKAMRNRTATLSTVCNCVSRLVDYSRLHFADEEQFMKQSGYPQADLQQHSRAHAEFLLLLSGFHDEISLRRGPSADQFEQTMKAWFEVHQENEDRRYLSYFAVNNGACSTSPNGAT
jgi:hemerythrin